MLKLGKLAYISTKNLFVPKGQAAQIFYDFGDDPKREYQVSKIVTHAWDVDNCLWFHIKWGIGDLTWEPLSNMDDIVALDEYLTLCKRWIRGIRVYGYICVSHALCVKCVFILSGAQLR